MEEAWRLMDERGYEISNLDVTLVLQVTKAHSLGHTLWHTGTSMERFSHMHIRTERDKQA
jgi:2C-methyl-D-erythritol 2,4-cyclodiphosphate synthase